MNDDINEAEGNRTIVGMSLSPRKLQQNVGTQGITLTRVNTSLTNSPTKITVIPATMRNTPIRIIPAPNKVVTSSNQISIPSGQQRVYTIQASSNMQGGVNPVMTAVSSTGQILHYTAQNVVKTSIPKVQLQGRQVQYLQLLNPSKSGTPVSCVATPVSSPPTQLALNSGQTLQMVVIPQTKHEIQVKSKPVTTAKIKPIQEVVTPKEDSKAAKAVGLPPEVLLPRKPCNCTKSQCLKLYCECFANGEFCNMCKCVNCFNNLDHESERQKAIKSCLDRNHDAFRPKIGKGLVGDGRRHNRGCQCKRSGCLKNYCECYEAKISCTDMCRCVGCRNSTSPSRDVKEEMKEIVDVKVFQDPLPKAYRAKLETESQKNLQPGSMLMKKPKVFMTPSVIEASCQCMVAQVVDAQRHNSFVSTSQLEQVVLEEFGKCLVHIVESATNLNANVSNGKIDSFT